MRKDTQESEDSPWGKGASDLSPDEKTIDAKTGFILAASLPLSILAFWKITLPFAYFTFSSLLGAELVQKVSFLSQDVFSLMTSSCPPWMTAEQRAFIANQSFQQVQRHHSPSEEEFDRLVGIGEPFIITDAMQDEGPTLIEMLFAHLRPTYVQDSSGNDISQGWPSSEEWSCPNFISNYPDAEFFDWQSHTDGPLKGVLSRSGYQNLDCLSGELTTRGSKNSEYLKDWLSHMTTPNFMDKGHGSLAGFIGVQGTGTPPTVDDSCSSFLSAQISGVTSWSFSWLIIEGNTLSWSRPVRSFLQPGEVIVWFPTMRFHTEVAEGCSLNFRFGFNEPSPTRYLQDVRTVFSSFNEGDGRENLVVNCDLDELDIVKECLSKVQTIAT